MTFFLKQLLSLFVLITLILSPLSLKAADKSVSTFRNISPQSTSGSPTQTSGANQPTLSDRTIGALPAIKFNGSAQYLNYNGAPLAGKDYTIFIVEQRAAAKIHNYFFGTAGASTNPNEGLLLGYETDTQLVFSQGGNKATIAIEPYSAGAKPIIHTFVQDSANGKKYYRNGALVFSDGANIAALVSNNNAQIGRNGTGGSTQYYQGNIAEVAVYKRAISAGEINTIHGYLLDKWDVTVTTDGTACLGTSTPHSPGYVTVANGVWPDANNGSTSAIDCSPLSKIDTINDMLCTNGVWSGGDGGGTCGLLSCSDTTPDANGTYGSAALTNSGTWGGATGSIAHNGTVTATCPGGPTGATPTLTCDGNTGDFSWNSGTCASPGCGSLASDLPVVTNYGWVDLVTATYTSGRVYGACNPSVSNGSDLTAADCDGTDWIEVPGKCNTVSIPIAYCPYITTFGNNHGASLDVEQSIGNFTRTLSIANGECVQSSSAFGGRWNLCCQSGKWATTAGDKVPFPGVFESTTAPLSGSSSCSNLYCVETNCGSLQAQHPDNASRTYPITASGSHGDIAYGDCISSGTTPRARCEASGTWNEYVSCP